MGHLEIDTETMGSRFVSLDVKVDRSYGSLSTRTESSYEIVEPVVKKQRQEKRMLMQEEQKVLTPPTTQMQMEFQQRQV